VTTPKQKDSRPEQLLSVALTEIEARLKSRPNAIELRFDRARCLEMLGRREEAAQEFGGVLGRAPDHVGALNGLGMLRLGTDDKSGARQLFKRAVAANGEYAPSRANYAYTLLAEKRFAEARAQYEAALRLDAQLAIAHHGLAETLEHLGDLDEARRHRILGMAQRPITALRYVGSGQPVRVLLLGSADSGNLVIDSYLDNQTFETHALVMEHYTPDLVLPPHDLVFNSIGEAERCGPALEAAAALLSRTTTAAVINHPAAVLATGRAANAARFEDLDGVITPKICNVARDSFAGATFDYPLLLRSPGYHTGQYFIMVESSDQLAAAVASLPGDELLAITYIDVRNPDNMVRKYRVMIVDGHLYPLHLAVASQWKVHYFSADMSTSPEHRAEDAAFLQNMPDVLGDRAMRGLEAIRDTLDLDYGGIDFSIDPAGNVIVFEANASMVVPKPGPEAIWAYRRAPVQRILDAVREMLLRRAKTHSPN